MAKVDIPGANEPHITIDEAGTEVCFRYPPSLAADRGCDTDAGDVAGLVQRIETEAGLKVLAEGVVRVEGTREPIVDVLFAAPHVYSPIPTQDLDGFVANFVAGADRHAPGVETSHELHRGGATKVLDIVTRVPETNAASWTLVIDDGTHARLALLSPNAPHQARAVRIKDGIIHALIEERSESPTRPEPSASPKAENLGGDIAEVMGIVAGVVVCVVVALVLVRWQRRRAEVLRAHREVQEEHKAMEVRRGKKKRRPAKSGLASG